MPKIRIPARIQSEHLIAVGVFVLLLLFTYAEFFEIPYVGFSYAPDTGRVANVFDPAVGDGIKAGDLISQIGPLSWQEFLANGQRFFAEIKPGQTLPFVVNRDGETLQVSFIYPGVDWRQISYRFLDIWVLAYVFWAMGTVALLFIRPKDERWILLISAAYLTALWLIVGTISHWGIWNASRWLRFVTCLIIPVFLHLHWVFPQPLRKVPRGVIWVGYPLAGALAVWQLFQPLPTWIIYSSIFLTMAAVIALLIAHYVTRPDQRRDIGYLVLAAGLVLSPLILFSGLDLLGLTHGLGTITLLFLPVLPGAYFYAVYRRQLGGLELRANRLISIYIFLISYSTTIFVLVAVTNLWFKLTGVQMIFALTLIFGSVLGVLFGFPSFQYWAEKRLLGMPLAPMQLLANYVSRIPISLDSTRLVHLLRDEILPSLFIRQSALLYVDEIGRFQWPYVQGIDAQGLPQPEDLASFRSLSGKYHPFMGEDHDEPFMWLRLILPLEVEGRMIGMWLLGRRDPDDYYSHDEIAMLQGIASQTAIAFMNIEQARLLSALYQADIDRQETERLHLALDLHDQVLNQLAVLAMSVDERGAKPEFEEAYQTATKRIREIISGLRPAMLNYGLRAGLEELVDDAIDIAGDHTQVVVEIPASQVRYPEQIELHLYRIIQQACQNALQHANARNIRVCGRLDPGEFDILVEDDGVGFAAGDRPDLSSLLASRHFGLAGMYERAALVGAEISVQSAPGAGTIVRLSWRAR